MVEPLAPRAGAAVAWKALEIGATRAIALLRLLVLARLLAPEDFGLFSIAVVSLGLVNNVTDLGMIPALVQREERGEAEYDAAWTFGLARAVMITGGLILLAPFIAAVFDEPRATSLIQALALRPTVEALASIKLAELTRNLRFRELAFVYLPGVVAETVLAISLASAWGVWALVGGVLVGAATSALLSYVYAPHRPRILPDVAAVKPLIRYGRWILLTGIVAVAGSSVLQVVVSRLLGTTSLGLYYLSQRLAFLPGQVASEVVGPVAFPLYARVRSDPEQTARAFRIVLCGLAVLLIPVYGLMIGLAPSIVENLLGARWYGTAPVIRVLAVVGLLGLFGDAVGPILKGLGRPQAVAALEALQSLLIIASVWWLARRYGLTGAAAAWIPAVAISQVAAGVFVRETARRSFRGFGRVASAILLCSLLGTLLGLGLDRLLPGLVGLLAAAGLGLVLTGCLLWTLDDRMQLGLKRDLARVIPRGGALGRKAQ